jgi:glycosyltransferase involved in cell wall biosynthesis
MAELLIVSLGSTAGLRASDAELAASLRRRGADVAVVAAVTPRQVRTLALTDLAWARAARVAAFAGIAREQPRAIIYSTITAALLAPTPGAIRLDALSAQNRPGRHGIWQRPRERAVLARATLLLPVSEEALTGAPARHAPAIVVPIVVERSGPALPREQRDIAAITYAANPDKKGLDRVLEAWAVARREGEELVLTGIDDAPRVDGVRLAGTLDRGEYRALLRRSRLYIAAPRREEFGIAQLEALADGCLLVSAPSPGPYAALPIARRLDERLIGWDLASALAAALADPLPGYAQRAAEALAPFRRAAVDRLVAEQLLPRLLGEGA